MTNLLGNGKNLTQEKNIRRSIPKGLPYFHVDFGMQNGFAHVIEDEQIFPRNFAPGKHIYNKYKKFEFLFP